MDPTTEMEFFITKAGRNALKNNEPKNVALYDKVTEDGMYMILIPPRLSNFIHAHNGDIPSIRALDFKNRPTVIESISEVEVFYFNEDGATVLDDFSRDNQLISFRKEPSKNFPYRFFLTSLERCEYKRKKPSSTLLQKSKFNAGGLSVSMVLTDSQLTNRLYKIPEFEDSKPIKQNTQQPTNTATSDETLEELIQVPKINISELKKDLMDNPDLITDDNDNDDFINNYTTGKRQKNFMCINVSGEDYSFRQGGYLIPSEKPPTFTTFVKSLFDTYNIKAYRLDVSYSYQKKLLNMIGDFKYKQTDTKK